MALELYNTLSKKKEIFDKPTGTSVGLYDCGPTVYDYAHIGNLRSYIFSDTLRRVLEFNGYHVNQVINITDIGHLSSDADDGEDKMTKALKREGKPMTLEAMREIANFYFEKFKEDLLTLNIKLPTEFPFASDHIPEDIELIEALFAKEFAYKTSDGISFDTAKMPDYGKLGLPPTTFVSGEIPKVVGGAQSRIGINTEKKNSRDFALWKFNEELGYDAPFGKGFPGWHIECSAMSVKYLGQPFDIHTGGIDHIPIHHNNEIAQSESANGKPLARYWMHNEFLNISGEKVAKSVGNTIYLRDLESHGVTPMAYRLWLLMSHYRSVVNFNWEALEGAENALKRLYRLFLDLGADTDGEPISEYQERFKTAVNNDLNTAEALTVLWDLLGKDDLPKEDVRATVLDFDRVFGLGFDKIKDEKLPQEILMLAKERDIARSSKDFAKSDEIRDKLISMGYEVGDSPEGTKVRKI